MRSILIIGTGHFGRHLCEKLWELGNEVMIVDKNEERMSSLLPMVTAAQVGDCTRREVVKTLGVGNFDMCFVCIGSDFESSLVITHLIKEEGAKYVISVANRDMQVDFLLRNGADEAVYPNRDSAERMGVKYGTNKVFDYIEMAEGYSMYEIPPLKQWIGKSIIDLNVRAKYDVTIIATKINDRMDFSPDIRRPLDEKTHLLIVGKQESLEKLLAR